jgi:hydrogenase nickel incorporation protein HypB
MFREADCVLITKTDLLPYLPVDIDKIETHIRQVNPRCTVLRVSASSGDGLDAWHRWVRLQVQQQLEVTAPGGAPALVTA